MRGRNSGGHNVLIRALLYLICLLGQWRNRIKESADRKTTCPPFDYRSLGWRRQHNVVVMNFHTPDNSCLDLWGKFMSAQKTLVLWQPVSPGPKRERRKRLSPGLRTLDGLVSLM